MAGEVRQDFASRALALTWRSSSSGGGSQQWIKAADVRATKRAPTSAAAPRPGTYRIYGYGNPSAPILLGSFELQGDRYRYLDGAGKTIGQGRFRFEAGAHKVEWLDGPFKEAGFGGEFAVERDGKTHLIRLNRATVGSNSTDA